MTIISSRSQNKHYLKDSFSELNVIVHTHSFSGKLFAQSSLGNIILWFLYPLSMHWACWRHWNHFLCFGLSNFICTSVYILHKICLNMASIEWRLTSRDIMNNEIIVLADCTLYDSAICCNSWERLTFVLDSMTP